MTSDPTSWQTMTPEKDKEEKTVLALLGD